MAKALSAGAVAFEGGAARFCKGQSNSVGLIYNVSVAAFHADNMLISAR